jgi:hypothetical protein
MMIQFQIKLEMFVLMMILEMFYKLGFLLLYKLGLFNRQCNIINDENIDRVKPKNKKKENIDI